MYSWQIDYIAVLLETNDSPSFHVGFMKPLRYRAKALSPVEPGSAEDQAIKRAQKVIAESERKNWTTGPLSLIDKVRALIQSNVAAI